MSGLRGALDDYLALRRSQGFKLEWSADCFLICRLPGTGEGADGHLRFLIVTERQYGYGDVVRPSAGLAGEGASGSIPGGRWHALPASSGIGAPLAHGARALQRRQGRRRWAGPALPPAVGRGPSGAERPLMAR